MSFPPIPVYPLAIDSDETLFLVYNTSEARLTSNNLPWSQEIAIEPVGSDEEEIWADNGFANISGELFYYDSVGKNSDGKVVALKRCGRNLGGKNTQFNSVGTWVRGFIIAEHHNQLVQAILNIENFIGTNDDNNLESLDYKIRNLDGLPACEDDHLCPDVSLDFEVIKESTDGCTGTTVSFDLTINGFFKKFQIDFGDGNSTTSLQSGTHNYAPNSVIDPIVTVTNDNCQVIQTGILRTNPKEPSTKVTVDTFSINVPEPPDFPPIVIPNTITPETTLTLPQIIFPCELGIGPIGPLQIPSIIVVSPPIPSFIQFSPLDIPSIISFSTIPSFSPISFGPAPSFSPVSFGPAPSFSPISFGPGPSFSPISFGPGPSFSPISFGPGPSFSPISFGPAPSFSPISFGPSPSFSPISFGPAPSFSPVSFGPSPSFSPISFGPAPSFSPVSFGPAPSFSPVSFGPAPSFSPISFGPSPSFSPVSFGPAPSFSPVSFGPAPSFSPVSFGPAPSFSPISFGPSPSFSPISFGPAPSFSPVSFGPAPSFSPVSFGPAPSFSPIAFGPAPSFSPISFGPAPSFSPIAFGAAPSIGPIAFGSPPSFSTVEFGAAPSIGPIEFGSAPSITVEFGSVPSIGPIEFGSAPSISVSFGSPPSIDVSWGSPPGISVSWGSPPACSCTMTVTCPGAMASRMAPAVQDEFVDPFMSVEMESQGLGIPSEINVVVPVFPDINIVHNLPKTISIEVPKFDDIRIIGPDIAIPSEIKVYTETRIPESIKVISDVPSTIKLESNLPTSIRLEMPDRFPSIMVDATGIPSTIQVVGMPSTVQLIGSIPSEITVKLKEDLEIPLVYRGGPIPVQFDFNTPSGQTGDAPCFALVPCGKT